MDGVKTLTLLRHAKSSWDDPALADHDRPLAPRGRRAAKRIATYLRDEHLPVSLVLCSSAARTRETVELVSPPGGIEIEDELYGASADQLLERLRRVPEQIDAVMLVGHNPAIHQLAITLASDSGELLYDKFPTAALATLTVTGPWRELDRGQGKLIAFVKPRELG